MNAQHIAPIIVFAVLVASVVSVGRADDRQTLQVGGATRSYIVRAPELEKNGVRTPLVIVLHGGGGNAENAERMTGFTVKARKEGFVVVYPEGSGRLRHALLTWNAGHCCGYAMKENVDDVAFISALIDKLEQSYLIDDKRIYITGMSNGGMMTHRLGIELSQRIVAIAPVVGAVFGDERKPAQPVAALMINGALDKSVPIQGGLSNGRGKNAWDGAPAKPALEQSAFWAQANGCSDVPTKEESGVQIRWRHRCPVGRDVELLLVKDNGHAWPGGEAGSRRGDKPSTSLNAVDAIWDFFKAHPA